MANITFVHTGHAFRCFFFGWNKFTLSKVFLLLTITSQTNFSGCSTTSSPGVFKWKTLTAEWKTPVQYFPESLNFNLLFSCFFPFVSFSLTNFVSQIFFCLFTSRDGDLISESLFHMFCFSRWSTLGSEKKKTEKFLLSQTLFPFLLSPSLQSVNYYERWHDDRFKAFV